MQQQQWEKLLNKLYQTPGESAAFYSAEKLRRALAQKYNLKIPIKSVQAWLEKKYAYAIHKPRRVNFERSPIIALHPDHTWQADILFLPELGNANKKFACVLVVIDVVSRFAWAQEMKSKSGLETTEAFINILKRSSPRVPQKLQTDKGTEFYNKHFKALMKKNAIVLYSTESDNKAAIAERFVRTLKELIYRYLEHSGTTKYVDQLQNLLQTYNSTYHKTIGMSPSEVKEENLNRVLGTLYSHLWQSPARKLKFKIGDKVRLSNLKHPFRKGYKGYWTNEIFTVSSVSGSPLNHLYEVTDYKNKRIKGRFYEKELQKASISDEDKSVYWRVEKIMRKKRVGNKLMYLIKWIGYADPTWEKAENVADIVDLRKRDEAIA